MCFQDTACNNTNTSTRGNGHDGTGGRGAGTREEALADGLEDDKSRG